jgi:hypothetical protein
VATREHEAAFVVVKPEHPNTPIAALRWKLLTIATLRMPDMERARQ